MTPRRPASKRTRPPLERCGACGERAMLGTCEFGKGNPLFVSGAHCRACCTRPERDRWRSFAESEGVGLKSESRLRRILRTYASEYAARLGQVSLGSCGRTLRGVRRLT